MRWWLVKYNADRRIASITVMGHRFSDSFLIPVSHYFILMLRELDMKLTFRKDFECSGGAGVGYADLAPYTVDGELIEGVQSCTVEAGVGKFPVMTLKVMVMETFAENVAVRLKQ
jgi:hypothetical protein